MAFDAFIKINGVDGESKDSAHGGEIEMLSFHWGVSQSGTAGYGGGGGGGKCSVSDFSFVHRTDKASPILFQKCCSGEHIDEADVTLRKAGGTQLEYLKYKFSDLIISSVRPGGSSQGSDDIPLEEVCINFAKCEIDYQPQGADGQADGGPVHGGWDVEGNQPV
jgi:type VI secretion system secreted protein Hcp